MFVPVLFTFLVAAAKLARAIPIIDDQIRVVCVLQDGHGGLPPGIFDDVFDKFGYRAPSVYEFLKVSAVVFSAEPKILDGDAKANDKKLVKRLLRASSHLKDCSGDIVMTERFVYFSEGLSEGAAPRRLDVGLPAWPGLAQRAAKLTEAVQQSAAKADDALERYQEWQKLNNVTNAEVLPNGNSVESVIGEGDHVDVVNVIVGKGLETAKLAVDAAQEHFALDAKIEVLPSDGSVVLDMFQAEKDGTFVELKPTPSFSVTQGDSEETQRGLSTLHPDPSDPPATTAADMPPIDTTSYYLVKEFHFGMDLGMASTNASELPAAIYTLRDVPPMVLRASAFADPRETTHTVMEVTLEGQAGPSLGTEDPSTTQETPTSYTTAASDMKRQRRDDDPVAGTVPVHSPFRTGVSPRDVPAGSGAGCAGPLLAVAAAVVALSV
eukprot:Polyplicarium_translucidae@DN2851_c0_g1_i2.p1